MKKMIIVLIASMTVCVGFLSGCNNKEFDDNKELDNDNMEFDIDLVQFSADILTVENWIEIRFSYNASQQIDSLIELEKIYYTLYGNSVLVKSNNIKYVDDSGIDPNYIPKDKNLGLSKDFVHYINIGSYNASNNTIYNWKMDCVCNDLKDAINRQIKGENVTIYWEIGCEFSFYVDGKSYSIEYVNSMIKNEYT